MTEQEYINDTNKYQFREIGEGEWQDCEKNWFEYCTKSAIHDTREIEVEDNG